MGEPYHTAPVSPAYYKALEACGENEPIDTRDLRAMAVDAPDLLSEWAERLETVKQEIRGNVASLEPGSGEEDSTFDPLSVTENAEYMPWRDDEQYDSFADIQEDTEVFLEDHQGLYDQLADQYEDAGNDFEAAKYYVWIHRFEEEANRVLEEALLLEPVIDRVALGDPPFPD